MAGNITQVQDAFNNACVKEAHLYVMLLSGRGDKNAAFHAFAGAFRYLFSLTINNTKLREIKYGENQNHLTGDIQGWFDTAQNYKYSDHGMGLFKEFNIALGRVGVL